MRNRTAAATADENDAITAVTSPAMNRVVFVVSAAGLLIAAYLWLAHARGTDIPCGGSNGCDKVAGSPYATFPHGSGLPVAAYGAAGYLLLALLAVARTLGASFARDRKLLGLIVLGAAGGTLFSLYLTYIELFVIKAICRWCMASQVLIVIVFLAALRDWLHGRRRRKPHQSAESSSVETLSSS